MAKRKNKKVEIVVRLQIPAGQANPSPPVGPALGQVGLNIMEFCIPAEYKFPNGLEGFFLLLLNH